MKENEERELSPPLEQLIDHMTNPVEADGSKDEGYDALDEGVEDEDGQEDVTVIQSYRDVMKVQYYSDQQMLVFKRQFKIYDIFRCSIDVIVHILTDPKWSDSFLVLFISMNEN